jgi:hypothetical protein
MKATIFDGLKGFNIPMSYDSDFGWDVYGQEVQDAELYSRVAIVNAAMNLNQRAVESLPFAIYDAAGNEWDTSADYQNKLGFLPNPRKLFGLWRKSLGFTNRAYGLMEKQRGKMELRYIVPNTIQIESSPQQGVTGFYRQLRGSRTYYPEKSGQLVYIHKTDYDTEILPSENTEFKALMSAAGILYWSDHYVQEFFKRGGIKPHMLMVKGAPTKEERERMEGVWDGLMKGLRRYIGKVYNAETVDAKAIGSGVDDFKDNEFYQQALQNVATVTGIPMSLLLANSANLATARQEFKTWFDYSVIPWAQFIADELNDKLFSRFDLTLEFLSEQTDPDQEEEFRRAGAFQIYANTFMQNRNPKPLSLAAQIVGLDLPKDVTLEDLDEQTEEPEEPQPAPNAPQNAPTETDPADMEDDTGEEDVSKSFVPNAAQIVELKTWLDIAERKHKKGEGVPTWENKTIPPPVYDAINLTLLQAKSIDDITQAFDLTRYTVTPAPEYKASSDIMALAEAINRLAERTPDASRNEPA